MYGADSGVDYVFVDEHNRHKRLKGRPYSWQKPKLAANFFEQ